MVPAAQVLRIDERLTFRLAEAVDLLQLEVWEEQSSWVDITGKGPYRTLLGHCQVPLDPQLVRRPCTWPIVSRNSLDGTAKDVGYVVCSFSLAFVPTPVRNLHVAQGHCRPTEVCLAWDPPLDEGGSLLRGYRIEAQEASSESTDFLGGRKGPIVANAGPEAAPSVVVKGLEGNSEYVFKVWPVSEAGNGPPASLVARSGPVAPGPCSVPRAADGDAEAPLCIEWSPPKSSGGAAIVAYRVWLRPIFRDPLGKLSPAAGFIDLGLVQHRGGPQDPQRLPLRMDALPVCEGCLSCVAALNSAGQMGPSTAEAPVYLAGLVEERSRVQEVASPEDSVTHSPTWTEPTAAEPGRRSDYQEMPASRRQQAASRPSLVPFLAATPNCPPPARVQADEIVAAAKAFRQSAGAPALIARPQPRPASAANAGVKREQAAWAQGKRGSLLAVPTVQKRQG